MDSIGHSSFLPTGLGRQDDEEVTPGVRPLQPVCVYEGSNCSSTYSWSNLNVSEPTLVAVSNDTLSTEAPE
ncbi:hypothetical protein TNCV_2484851 [Trichonephila clavipes]|uniref:Uncharacterized protein n=1 Tax=Trichonephila clavipes TaxID=2585209 RepID=A0A8X7BAV5_TRICX|nr:hypothetical protein TNCV_2484851 [Trichonephila clavipes]